MSRREPDLTVYAPLPGSLTRREAEPAEYRPIGTIAGWIVCRGADAANPVAGPFPCVADARSWIHDRRDVEGKR
ncbi:hypothetical protein M0638_25120 [Roseomonas sp. NAR14]|uniref:Uncharacterized protein n=1 Tax=Roseomonas acroporae TaxID=2937791 RepID=A0A9X1YCJ4_9PROT|nr:hypothetical protein [Roseomonas acroporae]MCK8787653.1 hypothetical protein [Roseomonas acroporae]